MDELAVMLLLLMMLMLVMEKSKLLLNLLVLSVTQLENRYRSASARSCPGILLRWMLVFLRWSPHNHRDLSTVSYRGSKVRERRDRVSR